MIERGKGGKIINMASQAGRRGESLVAVYCATKAAVISYTHYLAEIDAGRHENVAAPPLAVEYWNLPAGARLRDVVRAVRDDEAKHRDLNHAFADSLRQPVASLNVA